MKATQHINCGNLYLSLGDPENALGQFRAAVDLGRETGYTRDEGYSLMGTGVCLEHNEDPSGAAEAYRRAGELMETAYEGSGLLEDLAGKAEAMSLLGAVLHYSLDRPAEALDAYSGAVIIYRRLGNFGRLRKLLMNLAGLSWKMVNLEKSARFYEEALDLAREHGEPEHRVAALAGLGVVYRDLGRLKESVRRGKQAAELSRELEDLQAEAYVLTSLADSYHDLGYYPSALSCLKRSLRLRQKTGDVEGEVGALRDLARTYQALGEEERARDAAEEAANKEEVSNGSLEPITERRS